MAKTRKEKKIFILDTSVILFEHNSILNFDEHDIGIPITGVVENESYFICDGCEKRHELFGSGGGAKVAVATYGGERRNPVLFAREVWPLLEAELSGDEGARGILRRHPEMVVEVACDGVGDPADVDTREDLEALGRMRGLRGTYKISR